MTEGGLALRDLVGMMREGVVDAAAVKIEILAEIFSRDAGTLDMPAGIPDAERRIPFQLLILELGFRKPQNEVGLVLLVAVRLDALTHTDGKVLFVEVVEDVIFLQLGSIEIDVTACGVGIPLFQKNLNHIDEIGDTTGRRGNDVGTLDPQLFAIGKKRPGIKVSKKASV